MLTVVAGEGSGHEGGKDGSPSLVALVRAGAIFINGKLAERPQEAAA